MHRTGNLVEAEVTNVVRFTLLISADEFDLEQPIQVTVAGKSVFHDRVEPSVATLLKWAALDEDRTKLFAAEIEIALD